MLQDVLTVARPVFQSPENIDKLDMDTVGAHIECSLFASLPYCHLEIFGNLFDNLFDAPGMNPAVTDQL